MRPHPSSVGITRTGITRRAALGHISSLAAGSYGLASFPARIRGAEPVGPFRLGTFSVDVTPPVGHPLLANMCQPAKEITDRLSALGVVLTGGDRPVVIVSVDWGEIRNDAYDRWRDVLAQAAGTDRQHVLVSAIHQHDTPLADLEAQRILEREKRNAKIIDLEFHEKTVQAVAASLKASLQNARPCTHLGLGQAQVKEVASNRRYVNDEGQVFHNRMSATRDPRIRTYPEGTIDPWLKTLSFWDGEQPLAAISAYATHPMSYYCTGKVSADFPGLARAQRQAQDAKVTQIYVSGCSGNVTAGKFNDGSPQNRPVLAEKLVQAMTAAWQATKKHRLETVVFRNAHLTLEPRSTPGYTQADMQRRLQAQGAREQSFGALGLSWRKRVAAGQPIDLPCVDFGVAQYLVLPAEAYVEYQLLAQKLRPDRFVMVAGYGECAPGYIPHEQAWQENDGNLSDYSWVAPGAEPHITAALKIAQGLPR